MRTWINDHIDPTLWGDGPWLSEPDKAQWIDEATDLDCMAIRGSRGTWCGYVGVPLGYPAFDVRSIAVHGGITHSGECEDDPSPFVSRLCHEGEPGRDAVRWFGFECSHAGDYVPILRGDGEYRDLDYVKAECRKMARQIHG